MTAIIEDEAEILRRLDGGDAAHRLCLEFDSAYRAAIAQGEQATAARIITAFLSALSSDQVRARGLTISSANAWLSYSQEGRHFLRAALDAGAASEATNETRQRLTLDCRGVLAGLIRREGNLQRAEEILLDVAPPLPRTFLAWVKDQTASLLSPLEWDDGVRDSRNCYEIGYVHFLRGELSLARQWFERSAILARRSRNPVSHWISRCLAANCDFISARTPPARMRQVLLSADRVFARHAQRGDPNADRWTWNVANHLFETAFAEGDAVLGRKFFGRIETHTWPMRFGYTGLLKDSEQMSVNVTLLGPHRARLAMLERRWDDAIALFAEYFANVEFSQGNTTEALARTALDYGDALVGVGRISDARELWRRTLMLPSDQGNTPWQAQVHERLGGRLSEKN